VTPSFDIFQVNKRGQVLWQGFAVSGKEANETVQKLMQTSPSDYLILDQSSGNKVVVPFNDRKSQAVLFL
jgi:hypothetical protein